MTPLEFKSKSPKDLVNSKTPPTQSDIIEPLKSVSIQIFSIGFQTLWTSLITLNESSTKYVAKESPTLNEKNIIS
jgi:hypothetical protein